MKRLFKDEREKGQALVEWAFVLPMFLLLFCAILDFGWYSYQRLMFESAYQMTAWDFTLLLKDPSGNEVKDSHIINGVKPGPYSTTTAGVVKINGDATQYALGSGIKQHMLKSTGSLLQDSKLKVISATANFEPVLVQENYQLNGSIKYYDTYKVNVELFAELEYEIEPLTPFGKNVFFSGGKNVIKKNVVRKRNERVVVIREVVVPKP